MAGQEVAAALVQGSALQCILCWGTVVLLLCCCWASYCREPLRRLLVWGLLQLGGCCICVALGPPRNEGRMCPCWWQTQLLASSCSFAAAVWVECTQLALWCWGVCVPAAGITLCWAGRPWNATQS
jgi:hypothetical protein